MLCVSVLVTIMFAMDLLNQIDQRTEELRQLFPTADNDSLDWFACRPLDFEVRMQDPGYLRRLQEQELAKCHLCRKCSYSALLPNGALGFTPPDGAGHSSENLPAILASRRLPCTTPAAS